jgi:hypothetical protein
MLYDSLMVVTARVGRYSAHDQAKGLSMQAQATAHNILLSPAVGHASCLDGPTMKRSLSRLLNAALITIVGLRISSGAEPAGQSVLTYHADPGRSGNFIVRSLTWDRASSL